DHNRIPTTDARLLRRIARDSRTRGFTAQSTIRMWPSVRRGEENNIFPYQDSADVVFNSALLYETSLLKPYVMPLLFGIPKDSPEYQEAKRLLKFLDYFLTIPADDVPKTSLIREFIGGGVY
ncbi:MAG: nucleoside kinase, partial [Oscillospiraceae bacterium]|nr:nucleoside kinase [Oscillospiraceae bacterium]